MSLTVSRRIADGSFAVGVIIAVAGGVVNLRGGHWDGASWQALCLVLNTCGWWWFQQARALIDAKIQKARADAAMSDMALAAMRRAMEGGHAGFEMAVGPLGPTH